MAERSGPRLLDRAISVLRPRWFACFTLPWAMSRCPHTPRRGSCAPGPDGDARHCRAGSSGPAPREPLPRSRRRADTPPRTFTLLHSRSTNTLSTQRPLPSMRSLPRQALSRGPAPEVRRETARATARTVAPLRSPPASSNTHRPPAIGVHTTGLNPHFGECRGHEQHGATQRCFRELAGIAPEPLRQVHVHHQHDARHAQEEDATAGDTRPNRAFPQGEFSNGDV